MLMALHAGRMQEVVEEACRWLLAACEYTQQRLQGGKESVANVPQVLHPERLQGWFTNILLNCFADSCLLGPDTRPASGRLGSQW